MRRRGPGSPGPALLRQELWARRRALARIALWSIVESLPVLLSGLLVSAATDRFLTRDVGAGLALLALLLPTAAAGAVATNRLFPWLAALVEPVRDAFLAEVTKGALLAATRSTTRLDTTSVARLTAQVQTVRNILFGLLRTVRQVLFTFVAALVGLFLLAPVVASATAVLVALAFAVIGLLVPKLAARHRTLLLAQEEVAGRAGVAFEGVRDAVACAAQQRAAAEVERAVDDEATQALALARATTLTRLLVFVGGQLPLLMLLVATPGLLRSESLTVGEVVGAATYLLVSLEPALQRIVGVVVSWALDLVVSLRRLGEAFAEPEPAEPDGLPAPDRYDLRVEGLTFTYGAHADPVLDDLSLTIDEGDHLAVVGSSGIGKSTLANLLAGLLVPCRGAIRLGGVDVTRLRESELRRTLGLIPQEAYVFAGTLRENLTYLAPDATERDLVDAVAAVGLGPLLSRLGGLDARVGTGGADLSQGEKQLVALGRVYLSPARVVILDEATANLDPVAEARAEVAFAARPGTLVVIAHRITSARRAERVLLLDGDRVHLGTHDELVRSSSSYAELVGWWDAGGTATASRLPARPG
ncbi:ABC transporter ATP-binding protein [Micromonospora sp. CPCC 205546]|uniref:ABC transporter ATP-binding protein n=1 Tax=Micromonospora sp. CPCC 205546 TaxID=3122397 RepID=UPI002FF3708B